MFGTLTVSISLLTVRNVPRPHLHNNWPNVLFQNTSPIQSSQVQRSSIPATHYITSKRSMKQLRQLQFESCKSARRVFIGTQFLGLLGLLASQVAIVGCTYRSLLLVRIVGKENVTLLRRYGRSSQRLYGVDILQEMWKNYAIVMLEKI